MYNLPQKEYKSIYLSKEDFLQLENMLDEKLKKENIRKKFKVSVPNNNNLEISSMHEFLNGQLPKELMSISMSYIGSITNTDSNEDYLIIVISKNEIKVSIGGIEELMVLGLSQYLSLFFKEKKSLMVQILNLIPSSLAGVILGGSLFSYIFLKESILSPVLFGFLLLIVLGLFLANPVFNRIFPPVKITLTSKPKKNWGVIWTAIGAIVGILGFAYTIFK